MAIPSQAMSHLGALLEAAGPSPAEKMAALRAALPGISVTCCDFSDIDTEAPVLETPRFNLYLIDTREHCVKITTQPETATGVILAEKPPLARG